MALLTHLSIFPTTPTVTGIPKTVSINIDPCFEHTFQCGIIIYNGFPENETVQKNFTAVVNSYLNIWRDAKNVVDVLKNQ